MAERTKAPISKIGWAQALTGSNPVASAIRLPVLLTGALMVYDHWKSNVPSEVEGQFII